MKILALHTTIGWLQGNSDNKAHRERYTRAHVISNTSHARQKWTICTCRSDCGSDCSCGPWHLQGPWSSQGWFTIGDGRFLLCSTLFNRWQTVRLLYNNLFDLLLIDNMNFSNKLYRVLVHGQEDFVYVCTWTEGCPLCLRPSCHVHVLFLSTTTAAKQQQQ